MRKQVILLGILFVSLCVNFAFAQNTQNSVLENYWLQVPKSLTDWIKSKPYTGDPDKDIRALPSAMQITTTDAFGQYYVSQLYRNSDILLFAGHQYTQGLKLGQQHQKGALMTDLCQQLEIVDVFALASRTSTFDLHMKQYAHVTGSMFSDTMLDMACNRWTACVGGALRSQYLALYDSKTSAGVRSQVCYGNVSESLLSEYEKLYPLLTFGDDQKYSFVYTDGSGGNALFEVSSVARQINQLFVDTPAEFPDTTKTAVDVDELQALMALYVPDELIASTQQLLSQLNIDTTIDPRVDEEIAALIGQFETVDSTSLLATGSMLNMCVDPNSTSLDQVKTLIQQLQEVQQYTVEYQNALNTQGTLGDVIQGGTKSSDLVTQQPTLSSMSNLGLGVNYTPHDTVALSHSSLGGALDGIDTTMPTQEYVAGGASSSGGIGELVSGTSGTGLRACVSDCGQNYGASSSCVESCVGAGGKQGSCKVQCNNAKVACNAACLCGSSSASIGTGEREFEMFELRWCSVPTNRVKNPSLSRCISRDSKSGKMLLPPILCLTNNVVEQAYTLQESGKGGVRKNPREWFELSSILDFAKSLNFTITFSSNAVRQPQQTSTTKALNERNYEKLQNSTVEGIVADVVQKDQANYVNFIGDIKNLLQELSTQAGNIDASVNKSLDG